MPSIITLEVIMLYYVITSNLLGLVLYVYCHFMLISTPLGNYYYTKFCT